MGQPTDRVVIFLIRENRHETLRKDELVVIVAIVILGGGLAVLDTFCAAFVQNFRL